MRMASQAGLDVQKKTAHALEQDRSDVLRRREAWFEEQPDLDPARLVFVDETGLSTKMARLRGRAPRGERCRGRRAARALEDDHVHRRPPVGGHDRPVRLRRRDERARLPRLRRAGARSHALARRRGHHGQPARPQGHRHPRGHRASRRSARVPAALLPRLQSVYGWLLRVKDVGSVLVNGSVAAMYTASRMQLDGCAP